MTQQTKLQQENRSEQNHGDGESNDSSRHSEAPGEQSELLRFDSRQASVRDGVTTNPDSSVDDADGGDGDSRASKERGGESA